MSRLDEGSLKRIGEQFGAYLSERINQALSHTVVVLKVTDEYADVAEFDDDPPIRVPLMCLNAGSAVLKVKPKQYSTAIILYTEGDVNRPVFVGFTEVEEITVSVGESSVQITNDVIKFNGGDIGMVFADKLTDRLNKLQGEIEQIQTAISGHTHPYVIAPNVAATTSPPTYSKVLVSRFDASEYANDKITQ